MRCAFITIETDTYPLPSLLFPKSIVKDACKAGEDAVKALLEKALAEAGNDEKKIKSINEYFDIYQDLRGRFQDMMDIMIQDVREISDIKTEAGKFPIPAMITITKAFKVVLLPTPGNT